MSLPPVMVRSTTPTGRPEVSRLASGARPVAVVGILLGLMVAALARRPASPVTQTRMALAFELGGALLFSLIDELGASAGRAGLPLVSLWIVVFAMMVPLSTRGSLVGALGAAATGPAVGAALALAGLAMKPQLIDQVYQHVPSFVAVVLAHLGTRALREARDEARQLGSYRLVTKIGHGGMGEVWRAEHHLLTHTAAVKLVRVETLPPRDREVIFRRFEREARMTANLTSPHTVDLYDYGVSADGVVFYVMELIDGIDLERLVERYGPQPAARVAHFLGQACHSLAEAHAVGLIHRDIKPSNIICCRAGLEEDYVKVLDFGLVRPVARAEGLSLTRKGMVMGTPGFIAPEVALGRPDLDHRSDLYSLACVGYYLLSGRHVFDLRSPVRALHDHAYTRPPPLSETVGAPPALQRVIMSCLDKEPAARPRDAETMAALLADAGGAAWTQAQARGWWAARAEEERA
jgi:eukaryotic-like serine/threonine-protein kinase